MSENIFGIITRFGEDDFSYWEGFSLSEEEEKQIMAILLKHDTEGFLFVEVEVILPMK